MAETRNYAQRVMENLQVYSARMGASLVTAEPNLHRAATIDLRGMCDVMPTYRFPPALRPPNLSINLLPRHKELSP